MRSVIELAGSTATTEVVRAFGFIVRSSRNVDGVGLVIDIVTTIVAALSCCCNHTILPRVRTTHYRSSHHALSYPIGYITIKHFTSYKIAKLNDQR
jgi:hypothetical protein